MLSRSIIFISMIFCVLVLGACEQEGLGNDLSGWAADLYTYANNQGFTFPDQGPLDPKRKDENFGSQDLLIELNTQAEKFAHSELVIASIAQVRKCKPYLGFNRYLFNPFYVDDAACYEDFWHYVRPALEPIISASLKALSLPKTKRETWPVLHFRCSDSPFNKHRDYVLPKYSYYQAVLRHMKETIPQFYPDWYMVTGCGWNIPDDKKELWCKACHHYVQDLQSFFQSNLGIKLTIIDNEPVLEDWATMFNAPVLVSSSGSSLSFMAGIASKGHYYAPAYARQEFGKLTIQQPLNKYPSEFYFVPQTPQDILLHSQVDWEDYTAIIEKLRH